MLTNALAKSTIAANFADIRISAIALFITKLLDRKKFGGGIEQYRIFNTKTNAYVTTVADFLSQIEEADLILDYFRGSDSMTGDRTHPTSVIIGNYEVRWEPNAEEDGYYTSTYGRGEKRIMFLLNYLSDGDGDLPLKIFEVRLTSK